METPVSWTWVMRSELWDGHLLAESYALPFLSIMEFFWPLFIIFYTHYFLHDVTFFDHDVGRWSRVCGHLLQVLSQ
jgi:hypothetical protein